MKMKVNNNQFWILTDKSPTGETLLCDKKSEGVDSIREKMKEGIPAEKLDLVEVKMSDQGMELKGVNWSDIATLLVGGN